MDLSAKHTSRRLPQHNSKANAMSKSTMMNRIAAAAALLGALAAGEAQAALGDTLVATGGNVVIRFEGSDAGYDSLISVNGGPQIFANHATSAGTTVDLGTFAAGTVLDIVLHVVTTGQAFHTGTGAGNPDGLAHANVVYDFKEPGRTWIGFEDIAGGGDRDYNDHQFSFINVQAAVPEPTTCALMLAGLAGVGALARRTKAAKA